MRRIADGEWQPPRDPLRDADRSGARLSQGTVRKALDEMTAERLLIRRQASAPSWRAMTRTASSSILHWAATTAGASSPDSTVLSAASSPSDATEPPASASAGAPASCASTACALGAPLRSSERIVVPSARFAGLAACDPVPNNLYGLYRALRRHRRKSQREPEGRRLPRTTRPSALPPFTRSGHRPPRPRPRRAEGGMARFLSADRSIPLHFGPEMKWRRLDGPDAEQRQYRHPQGGNRCSTSVQRGRDRHGPVHADDGPDLSRPPHHPDRPFAAGGPSDVLGASSASPCRRRSARASSSRMSRRGRHDGPARTARAAADGYTLLIHTWLWRPVRRSTGTFPMTRSRTSSRSA